MPGRVIGICLVLGILWTGIAEAHFGMIIPSRSMVLNNAEARISVDVAFAHPFAGTGMNMEPPELAIWEGGKRTGLGLTEREWLGERAYQSEFTIRRPGVYILGMTPKPYFEPSEERFIIHYTKTVIGAFGYEDGYGAPIGQPVEIVPLTRPFGNYAGNSFSGVVLFKGQPLPGADVEIEFLNEGHKYAAPNPYFETQVAHTDANGVFTFTVPWPGWWGFAALTTGPDKIAHDGELREVELGGVIWLEFHSLPERR